MTATIALREGYRTRSIRPLGLWEPNGWRLKVYGIAYEKETPREELVEAIEARALDVLPDAAGGYGTGFLIAHDARGVCVGIVDWWADENELHHRYFESAHNRPRELAPVDNDRPIACAWDLAVMAFERKAWVDSVLANPSGPSVEAYLALQMHADV